MANIQTGVSTFETKLLTAVTGLDSNPLVTGANAGAVAAAALMTTGDFKSLVPSGTFDPAHGIVAFTGDFQAAVPIASTGINFNLGLPGVPFALTADLQLGVEIDYGYVTFGVNNGIFTVQSAASPPGQPNQPTQLTVSLTATAADLNLHGTIGFFQFTGSPVPSTQPGVTPPPPPPPPPPPRRRGGQGAPPPARGGGPGARRRPGQSSSQRHARRRKYAGVQLPAHRNQLRDELEPRHGPQDQQRSRLQR